MIRSYRKRPGVLMPRFSHLNFGEIPLEIILITHSGSYLCLIPRTALISHFAS